MADIFVKQRGGTRGGLEQFKWDDVKDQKYGDRECYLGASVKVGQQGRGQFNTNDWWQKDRQKLDKLDEEKAAVQRYEEELMQEALGLRPKKHLLRKQELNAEQIKELFRKEEEDENADAKTGVGFGAYGSAGAPDSSTDKLAGSSADALKDFDIEKAEREEQEAKAGGAGEQPAKPGAEGSPRKRPLEASAEQPEMDERARKKLKKQEKKEAKKEKKRAKKEKKKEKKRAKKEKKRLKKEAKKSSSSSSSSDSD